MTAFERQEAANLQMPEKVLQIYMLLCFGKSVIVDGKQYTYKSIISDLKLKGHNLSGTEFNYWCYKQIHNLPKQIQLNWFDNIEIKSRR